MGAVRSLSCRAGCASPVFTVIRAKARVAAFRPRPAGAWLVSRVVFFVIIVLQVVIFVAVNMPCSGTFHFSHIADYMTFVLSLTHMLAFLSLSIRISILVCAAAILYCACLVNDQDSAPHAIPGSP